MKYLMLVLAIMGTLNVVIAWDGALNSAVTGWTAATIMYVGDFLRRIVE